jgi:hypothetical protein
MEDYHLPICMACYAVRVEPARRYLKRPTCAGCGETEARAVRLTIAPLNKSNYVLITVPTILKQLNPKRTEV